MLFRSARTILQKSAKLEFWDTYRAGDEGIIQALDVADAKLKALMSGDTSAALQPLSVKDTTYVFPTGPDGQPDTTKPKEMQVVDRPVDQLQGGGPLFAQLSKVPDGRSMDINALVINGSDPGAVPGDSTKSRIGGSWGRNRIDERLKGFALSR